MSLSLIDGFSRSSTLERSPLPVQSRELSSRSKSVYCQTISQTPVNESFKDAVYSSPPNFNHLSQIIHQVAPQLIEEAYTLILEVKTDLPVAQKGPLLEFLLSNGALSQESQKKIFGYSSLMGEMNESFLVDLFLSQDQPEESLHLAFLVKGDKTGRDLFAFCWKHNLQKTLFFLGENPFFSKSFPLILKSMTEGLAETEIETLLFILPYFKSENWESIFAYFRNLAPEQKQDPGIIAFEKAFFSCDFVRDYALSVSPEFRPTLDQLAAIFTFQWNCIDTTDSKQMRQLEEIAQEMYQKDPTFFDRLIAPLLENGLSVADLCKPIVAILTCLSLDVSLEVERQLSLVINKNPNSPLIRMFVSSGQKHSLTLWKPFNTEKANGFSFVTRGSQIGKNGSYELKDPKIAFTTLNASAPNSIYFDANKIKSTLSGGVCSAMSFRSIKRYRKFRSTGMSPAASVRAIGKEFDTASAEFRSIQAIYNTISRKQDAQGNLAQTEDFKKDKIEALLKFDNPECSVMRSSEDINLNDLDATSKITALFDSLPEGIFIVRALNPLISDSDKQQVEFASKEERYGHTTYLIKEEGENFYYDPSIGFVHITAPEQVDSILRWENFRWNIPSVRFYQVA